jgi:plastocyanin
MIIRAFAGVGAAAAVALALVTAGWSSGTAGTALRGTVGPGFTIKLTKAGRSVRTLRAGTYRLTVADRSAQHNFVLEKERGAERVVTSIAFVGTKTITVRLTKGAWKVYCEPHAASMVSRFAVGGAPLTAARTTPPVADDHGGHGEAEPGDDHGGR